MCWAEQYQVIGVVLEYFMKGNYVVIVKHGRTTKNTGEAALLPNCSPNCVGDISSRHRSTVMRCSQYNERSGRPDAGCRSRQLQTGSMAQPLADEQRRASVVWTPLRTFHPLPIAIARQRMPPYITFGCASRSLTSTTWFCIIALHHRSLQSRTKINT